MTSDANNSRVSRRKFLAGISGAALSLPYLESIAAPASAATGKPATRLAFFYLPNGLTRRGFFPGESDRALPNFAGQNNVWRFEGKSAPVGSHAMTITPTMKALHPFKDRISLITGMDRTFKNGQDVHAQGASCFLTSVSPDQAAEKGWRYPNGRSLDQVLGAPGVRQLVLRLGCSYRQRLEDVLLIPLAAGVLIPVIDWHLPPSLAAAAMAASSVSVVANSLLLRWRKL